MSLCKWECIHLALRGARSGHTAGVGSHGDSDVVIDTQHCLIILW